MCAHKDPVRVTVTFEYIPKIPKNWPISRLRRRTNRHAEPDDIDSGFH